MIIMCWTQTNVQQCMFKSNVRFNASSELQAQLTSLSGELYQNKDFKRAKFPWHWHE